MTARFAGSRSLDERRRRRLATDTESTQGRRDTPRLSFDETPAANETSWEHAASHFSLHRIIPANGWKLGGIALLGLMVGAALLAIGGRATDGGNVLGPGFVRLFDLSTGRVIPGYGSLLLMLSSQLALLIWWVRSRSAGDFDGQYGVWLWGSAAGFLLAFCGTTDAHIAFSESVFWFWDVEFWNREVWGWLIPAAVGGAGLLRALHFDMRDCRLSLAMLWLAAICWLSAGILRLDLSLPIDEHQTLLLQAGTPLSAHLFLFVSMLLHARYVIYESAEPPAIRPSRFKALLQRLRLPKFPCPPFPRLRLRLPKLLLRFRLRRAGSVRVAGKVRGEKPAEEKEHAEKAEKPAGTQKPSARRQRKQKKNPQPASSESGETSEPADRNDAPCPAKEAPPAAADPPAAEADDQAKQKEKTEESIPSDSSKTGQPEIRFDQPLDKELLKGLSKRERRKLQKQWREQQRTCPNEPRER